MPRVSAVMPAYNAAPFIQDAVRSVLRQTFEDFELIVVDDGSTDGTAEVPARVDDPRVVVHRIEHAGLTAAENAGLELARGELLVRVDADDLYAPTLFERQVAELDAHPEAVAVVPWTREFGLKQDADRPPTNPREVRRGLRRWWTLNHPTMARTSVVRELGGFRPVFYEHWDLWIRLAARGDIRVIPECLALIRVHPSSMFMSSNPLKYRLDKLRLRRIAMRRLGADPRSVAGVVTAALAAARFAVLPRSAPRRGAAAVEPSWERPTVSVVVPTYRRPELLARCLEAVEAQDPPPEEIVVVHRTDDEATAGFVRTWVEGGSGRVAAIVERPGLYRALVTGAEVARSDVIVYVDDDAAPRAGWLEELLRGFTDPRVGVVGGRIVDHAGGKEVTGRTKTVGGITWYGRVIGRHFLDSDVYGPVDWVTGANLAIRSPLARFDPQLRHSGNGLLLGFEVDLCLGVQREGFRIIYTPWAIVDHETTSFRDPKLGTRVVGGDITTSAANHTYALLKHLSPPRRAAFRIYAYVIGSSSLPGPVRAGLEAVRSPRRAVAMAGRIPSVWRGRRQGGAMWREWRRERSEVAPRTDPERASV